MARKPFTNSLRHGLHDAHSVERAERRSRLPRPAVCKERIKAIKAARVATRRLLSRLERLTRGPGNGRWSIDDSIDRRIRGGDPVAAGDALNVAISKLTRVRDRLDSLHGIGG